MEYDIDVNERAIDAIPPATGLLVQVGGCVSLDTSDGKFTLMWPKGAAWDPVSQSGELDGRRYQINTEVAIGGTMIVPSSLETGEEAEQMRVNADERLAAYAIMRNRTDDCPTGLIAVW